MCDTWLMLVFLWSAPRYRCCNFADSAGRGFLIIPPRLFWYMYLLVFFVVHNGSLPSMPCCTDLANTHVFSYTGTATGSLVVRIDDPSSRMFSPPRVDFIDAADDAITKKTPACFLRHFDLSSPCTVHVDLAQTHDTARYSISVLALTFLP